MIPLKDIDGKPIKPGFYRMLEKHNELYFIYPNPNPSNPDRHFLVDRIILSDFFRNVRMARGLNHQDCEEHGYVAAGKLIPFKEDVNHYLKSWEFQVGKLSDFVDAGISRLKALEDCTVPEPPKRS